MNQALPHVLLDEPPNPINEEQRDLWCSVIQQAVEDFRGCNDPADKDSHHHKRLRYEDAKRWLESDNTCPNSFLALCDLLGLDPGAIRHRLFTEKKNFKPDDRKERSIMEEKTKCRVQDCSSFAIVARGLCGIHYDRWRHGKPEMIEAMGGRFIPTRTGKNVRKRKEIIAPASQVIKTVMAKAKAAAGNGRAEALADEHWAYIRSLLVAHGDDGDPEELAKIEFHYKSAMIHGYKHGVAERERPAQS